MGGGGIVTVTVAWAVTVPLGPDAVNVYVVVLEGDTVLEPDVETPPIPGLIEALVTPLLDQNNVEEFPNIIDEGLALIEADGGGGQDPGA